MSKPLTHAHQNAILARFSWTAEGMIRVRATHNSEPLLRLAGIPNPVTLEYYNVPVMRDSKGFLIVDTNETAIRKPVSDSDDSLFEAGGLFAGERDKSPKSLQSDFVRQIAKGFGIQPLSARAESLAPEIASLCELTCTRTFEITTGPQSKVRVQIIAFEDQALPSPGEREQWGPKKPTDTDIRAAAAAMHMARELSHFEQI
jgi:hypothetical protein